MSDFPVSVVIPTYNRAAYLGRAIDSVLSQTCGVLETIVVDDGSIDGTREIADGYAGRIRYLHQANAGVSAARNVGIAAARGEWIAFLDSDDVWLPTKLERQFCALRRFGAEGGVCLCFTDAEETGLPEGPQRFWERMGFRPAEAMGILKTDSGFFHRGNYPVLIPSVVMKRELVERLGGFNTEFRAGEDTDFILRAAARADFCYVNEPLLRVDCSATRAESLSLEWRSYHVELAVLYLERSLQDVLTLKPECIPAASKRLLVFLDIQANAQIRRGQFTEALVALDRSIELAPSRAKRVKRWLTRHWPALARRIVIARTRKLDEYERS